MESKDTKVISQITSKHIVTYKDVPVQRGNVPNYTATREETVQVYGDVLQWLNGMNTDPARQIIITHHSCVNLDEILSQAIKEAFK